MAAESDRERISVVERNAGRDAGFRLVVFLVALAALGVAETVAPARFRTLTRAQRWPAAATLALLAGVVGRLVQPAALAGAAVRAKRGRVGLRNRASPPRWSAWIATLVLLDLAVWAQHVLSHKHPGFWRLHRVHHSDPDLDVTTGVRFHPLEIAVSGFWKAVVAAAIGAPAGAVLAFEVWLSTGALFTHANVRLPRGLDRVLRRVMVTPSSHRLHHRIGEAESQVNFGFGLAVWDQLFGVFSSGEVDDDDRLGVAERWRSSRDQQALALLIQPLKR